jgi:hypothetical protein
MSLRNTALVLVLAAPVFGRDPAPRSETLIAHEWGTFTSVAGERGNPVLWAPLSGPGDLPCFVNRISFQNYKAFPGLVRMETPVLYFYTPRPVTLSVHVDFPQGWITEWYPQAAATKRESNYPAYSNGRIDWDQVQILPGENLSLPSSRGASHYYAARNTDSAPLRAGQQQEKLIFYRGIGSFLGPLRPVFKAGGQLEIRNAGSEPIPLAILFENRNGKIGYRTVRGVEGSVALDPPQLTGSLEQLRQELAGALVETGLYRKEALAMIETWRDAWFEEGTRVFYIFPRPEVDRLLPLTITPAPAAIERVFVGRVEVLSPWMRQTIETELTNGDVPTLAKFGRFLEPFAQQVRLKNRDLVQSPAAQTYFREAYNQIERERNKASCVE